MLFCSGDNISGLLGQFLDHSRHLNTDLHFKFDENCLCNSKFEGIEPQRNRGFSYNSWLSGVCSLDGRNNHGYVISSRS